MSCLKCIITQDKTLPLFSFFFYPSACSQHDLSILVHALIWAKVFWALSDKINLLQRSSLSCFLLWHRAAVWNTFDWMQNCRWCCSTSFFMTASSAHYSSKGTVFVVSELHYGWLSLYIIIIPEHTIAYQRRHNLNARTPRFCITASLLPHFHALKCAANTQLNPLPWKAVMLNSSFTKVFFIGSWKIVCVGDCFLVWNM